MSAYKNSKNRWQFANIEELVDYIAHEFEIEPLSKRLIRVTGSQLRSDRKVRTKENNAIRFHDPVLDHITSSNGEIVIDSRSYNIQARRLKSSKRGTPTLYPPANNYRAANAINCYEDPTTFEFCQSDDGSTISYSDKAGSSIVFVSFKKNWGFPFTFAWKVGTKIRTFGPNLFEAGIIDSRYYIEESGQICSVEYGHTTGTNDNDLEEYMSFFGDLGSNEPTRVESLCRVFWNGHTLKGVVSLGQPCSTNGDVTPWPEELPDNWPTPDPNPIGAIIVTPLSLGFNPKTSTSVTKIITIKSTHTVPVTVTVEEAKVNTTSQGPVDPLINVEVATGEYSNVSGQFTIPPNGSVQIEVTFSVTKNGFGSVPGSLRIIWDSGVRDIALIGTIEQVPVVVPII